MALVHMSPKDDAVRFLSGFGLGEVHQISDPQCNLYQQMGLAKARLPDFVSLKVLGRVFQSYLSGFRQGRIIGDPMQMPGMFVIYQGKIIRAFCHKTIADNPDYDSLIVCPLA